MLEGGELDYLNGDYLAELTMLILGRDRLKDPGPRLHAKTFLRQLEDCLGLALDKGVKIVSNAGGLNPHGLAVAIRELSDRLGLDAQVAFVSGDDLIGDAGKLGFGNPLTANAYLGAFGIKAALDRGADVVVTGRVTDASLTVGPAAAAFGWDYTDLDALAGAVVAGPHPRMRSAGHRRQLLVLHRDPDGAPRLSDRRDQRRWIVGHHQARGHRRAVTVGTVTAQLLYEVGGPVTSTQTSPRAWTPPNSPRPARIASRSAVCGREPAERPQVSLNFLAGLRNQVDVVLTGLDIDAKAALFEEQFALPLSAEPADLTFSSPAPTTPMAPPRSRPAPCCASSPATPTRTRWARLSSAIVDWPSPVTPASPDGAPERLALRRLRARLRRCRQVTHRVIQPDGVAVTIDPSPLRPVPVDEDSAPGAVAATSGPPCARRWAPVAGARSGDKGGSANIGVWVRSDEEYTWLDQTLTVEKVRELLPEVADLTVHRYALPNLRAVNFVIEGVLGRGVADNALRPPRPRAWANGCARVTSRSRRASSTDR